MKCLIRYNEILCNVKNTPLFWIKIFHFDNCCTCSHCCRSYEVSAKVKSLSRKLNSSLSITPQALGKQIGPPSCGGDSESASKKYIDRLFVIWASGLCFGSVLGIFQFSILFYFLRICLYLCLGTLVQANLISWRCGGVTCYMPSKFVAWKEPC